MLQPSGRLVKRSRSVRQDRDSLRIARSGVPSIWARFLAASLIAVIVSSFMWALGTDGDRSEAQLSAARAGIVQTARTERQSFW